MARRTAAISHLAMHEACPVPGRSQSGIADYERQWGRKPPEFQTY
jgi:hypothetical protein